MLVQLIKSDAASLGVMRGPRRDNSVKVDRWMPNFTTRGEGNESEWKNRRLGVKISKMNRSEYGDFKQTEMLATIRHRRVVPCNEFSVIRSGSHYDTGCRGSPASVTAPVLPQIMSPGDKAAESTNKGKEKVVAAKKGSNVIHNGWASEMPLRRQWKQGKCTRGNDCRFKHDIFQVRDLYFMEHCRC